PCAWTRCNSFPLRPRLFMATPGMALRRRELCNCASTRDVRRSARTRPPYPQPGEAPLRLVFALAGRRRCAPSTDLQALADLAELLQVGPARRQADHDTAATHHHFRRHLDEQRAPRPRLPLAQGVLLPPPSEVPPPLRLRPGLHRRRRARHRQG